MPQFGPNVNEPIEISAGDDNEDEGDRRNSKHMDEESVAIKKERNKVIETEDASRGPLSGCIRLADSSRVIQRLKVSCKGENFGCLGIVLFANLV